MTKTKAPIVERVAGWSARHRLIAVFGWLLLVVAALMIGHQLGTTSLNSYDPGQAGQAERVLSRPGVVQPATETVLVQARAPGRTVANDPRILRAASQVAGVLSAAPKVAADVRYPHGPGGRGLISRDGRSALVTFTVAGNTNDADQTVAGALRAV